MADYPALEAIATKHGLIITEDAAQSFGAEQNGCKAGTMGAVATTSFFRERLAATATEVPFLPKTPPRGNHLRRNQPWV